MGGTGDDRWYSDSNEYGVRASEGDIVVEDNGTPRGAVAMIRRDNTLNDGRLTGKELAGEPKEALQAVVEIFQRSDIAPHNIKDLDTFEQTMVAVMLRQFHILVTKQRGYRHSNVEELDISGLLGRISEKVVRAKEELGDPKEQVKKARALMADLEPDADVREMAQALSKIDKILNPGGQNDDTIDNLVLDIANLSEILYAFYYDAWFKPLDEDVQ